MGVEGSSAPDEPAGSIWSSLCGVCRSSKGKYRCPHCSVVTCSLSCSKGHKTHGECTGARTRTRFVPLSEFDDSQLLSDVGLLSSAAHACGRAQRASDKVFAFRHLSRQHRHLRRVATRKGIKLSFLSARLFKHQENQSRADKTTSAITWCVEWHFFTSNDSPGDAAVTFELRDDVPLLQGLVDALTKEHTHIFQRIKRVCTSDSSDWAFFLEQPKCPANRRLYHPLCPDDPLDKSLAGKAILERPVIHVASRSDGPRAYELYSKEKMDDVVAQRDRALLQLLEPRSGEDDHAPPDQSERVGAQGPE
ncbi:uncharacterized protein LOC126318449 [Schistocerca gregaria]|uniref:uncharacterized protein LOC126318449 n=1 Tax=Schistocerca gregaria TaxID=7010 RepID=UPI00211E1D91|nr:uncharacterized protein LOC126318449 [Schistocerca gregaria]